MTYQKFQKGDVVKVQWSDCKPEMGVVSRYDDSGLYFIDVLDDNGEISEGYALGDRLTLVSRPSRGGRMEKVDYEDLGRGDVYYTEYRKGGFAQDENIYRFVEGDAPAEPTLEQAAAIVVKALESEADRRTTEFRALSQRLLSMSTTAHELRKLYAIKEED